MAPSNNFATAGHLDSCKVSDLEDENVLGHVPHLKTMEELVLKAMVDEALWSGPRERQESSVMGIPRSCRE